jgi:Ca2+-binding EF-hand superfamily protein
MDESYYVPPHLSYPFTKDEMVRYVAVYAEHDAADGDADGFIEADALEALMAALDEKPTAKKREELLSVCDPENTGQVESHCKCIPSYACIHAF